MTTPQEASEQAHRAGVEAYELLANSDDDCQCEDCFVREILEAAWPHLRTLVRVLDGVMGEHNDDPLAIDPAKVDPVWLPHLGNLR